MEQNKENINWIRLRTKIPLPVDPLPPVPRHLTIDKIHDSGPQLPRIPLRTINNQAGPSKEHKAKKRKQRSTPLKLDVKHVTVRRNIDEKLDWDYHVFKDAPSQDLPEPDSTVLTISDDDSEDIDDELVEKFAACSLKSKTPLLRPSPLEVSRVKNIKRSLKRPHSRELQGLSPLTKQRKKEEDKAKRRLTFMGRYEENLNPPDNVTVGYTKSLDYKDDIFEYLQSTETIPSTKCQPSKFNRACVINWLIKVNGPVGDPAVLQSACWYLDKILSIEFVALEKLQLVASACYWIAQKLYQPSSPATKLVKCAGHAFTTEQLLYSEMKVLKLLFFYLPQKFPPQPIVPHDFTAYLSWMSDQNKPGVIELAATFIVTSSLLINYPASCDYPSVVAAAAVKNALLSLELMYLLRKLKVIPMYLRALAKAKDFKELCAAQRKAVKTISQPTFDYRAPFDHYDAAPLYIARTVVKGILKLERFQEVHSQDNRF